MNDQSNYISSEADLINGCMEGNRQMQEILYKIFTPKTYGICMRYSGNVKNAKDLLQEGFIKLFKNLHKFRGEGTFEGWIRRIFINTSIEHFRKKSKMYNVTDISDNKIGDTYLGALDSLAEKDILYLVNELSPCYKSVFNLHVIEGCSHKEIAEILDITEGTIKSQLSRAKAVLKKNLEEKFNIKNHGRTNY